MEQTVIATVEIDLPTGKKIIKMELKDGHEIEDCDEDKVIVCTLKNGDEYTGIFKGLDGNEDVILDSLSGDSRIGLKISWIIRYLEEL